MTRTSRLTCAWWAPRPTAFFGSYGGNVTAAVRDLGEEPAVADLIGGVKTMLDAYEQGKIDRLFLVSNEFVNTMTQKPGRSSSCCHLKLNNPTR